MAPYKPYNIIFENVELSPTTPNREYSLNAKDICQSCLTFIKRRWFEGN